MCALGHNKKMEHDKFCTNQNETVALDLNVNILDP